MSAWKVQDQKTMDEIASKWLIHSYDIHAAKHLLKPVYILQAVSTVTEQQSFLTSRMTIYSAESHGNPRHPHPMQTKSGKKFGNKQVEWTEKVEMRKEEFTAACQ